jgi:hypothetical protein
MEDERSYQRYGGSCWDKRWFSRAWYALVEGAGDDTTADGNKDWWESLVDNHNNVMMAPSSNMNNFKYNWWLIDTIFIRGAMLLAFLLVIGQTCWWISIVVLMMFHGLFGGFSFITIQQSATIILVYLNEISMLYING